MHLGFICCDSELLEWGLMDVVLVRLVLAKAEPSERKVETFTELDHVEVL